MHRRFSFAIALILTLSLVVASCSSPFDDDEDTGNGQKVEQTSAQSDPTTAIAQAEQTEEPEETEVSDETPQTSEETPVADETATKDSESDDDEDEESSGGFENQIEEVTADVRPAVAYISIVQEGIGMFGQEQQQEGVGSGVIFDESGLILTNNHVVEGADELTVILPDSREFEAEVLGRSPALDLALIQIEGEDLPTAPLGSSADLEIGQWVVAIGNALGLPGGSTVTAGIVSAMGRTLQAAPNQPAMENLIQTSAAINPGNSGGPLVNLDGEVVGINTARIQQAEGIGFAVSIDDAKEFIEAVQSDEPQAALGITGATITPALVSRFDLPVQEGVILASILPDSAAEDAGLQQGDVIVGFDGEPIDTIGDLRQAVNDHAPGDTVTVTINRDGQEEEIDVTLGESNIIQ